MSRLSKVGGSIPKDIAREQIKRPRPRSTPSSRHQKVACDSHPALAGHHDAFDDRPVLGMPDVIEVALAHVRVDAPLPAPVASTAAEAVPAPAPDPKTVTAIPAAPTPVADNSAAPAGRRASDTSAAPAGRRASDKPAAPAETSIRISVSILDDLMSLVSELVLGRTRLQTLRTQLQDRYTRRRERGQPGRRRGAPRPHLQRPAEPRS